MAKTNPFVYVESINSTKKQNLIRTAEDPYQAEKDYNPYLTNHTLSYFQDVIIFVNELNKYNQIDKKLQYEFLLYLLRPGKRRSKWAKQLEVENLDLVKRYYNYNTAKALTALSILSDNEIAAIRAKLDPGGVK